MPEGIDPPKITSGPFCFSIFFRRANRRSNFLLSASRSFLAMAITCSDTNRPQSTGSDLAAFSVGFDSHRSR
jgi:hypothetical protein